MQHKTSLSQKCFCLKLFISCLWTVTEEKEALEHKTSLSQAYLASNYLFIVLRCFGHVERSSGAVRTACDIQVDGRWGHGGLSRHGRN